MFRPAAVRFFLATFFFVPALSLAAVDMSRPQFTFSCNFNVDNADAHGRSAFSHLIGMGEYLYAEYRFDPAMSMGLGGGVFRLGDNYEKRACPVDIEGHLYPVRFGSSELFLTGGAGVTPFRHLVADHWAGRFHAMTGAGYRRMLGGNYALDLAGYYHFFTPIAHPMETFSLNVGLTVMFGARH